ncbi:hypothetical protein BJ508DRAFT_209102 [Ascobolus immersus RN42]|uniref:Uracil permease n=1 Tax=Ascobolus immersus RN42 TaxID=1160509 RepID=A0A3N4I6A1_ASCIM|nr:hypothetical protein BJ508DRAFT_209102 [Ascobolus immersus RN42]
MGIFGNRSTSTSVEATPRPGGWKGLVHRLETKNEPGLSTTQLMLINHDLKPVEPARRQWGPWNFVGFWIADSFNINTWMISSSMIVAGLTWWQSWLCVWSGYFLAACFLCLNGRIGAVYHVGFPVISRSSFGIWGALWPVFNRAVMACVWYGVQAWIGGQCVNLMIRSIWESWNNIPNTMESSQTHTNLWVSFFIFWLCSLPAIWFPVHKIRHLFTVKSYVVPVAGFAFFGWMVKRAGGLGPIIHQPAKIHGADFTWAIVTGIMSAIANFAALIVNDPDFTRFAGKPRDALWSQLLTIPCGFAVTSFVGIIVSSSSAVMYEDPIWNPLDLLHKILEEGGAGNRAGVFLIASSFALAQLGTNIAANSVSCGTDLTALAPRFLNIRRGGYICALVGLVMCPWYLLSDSNRFTTYLSAYSVFLSSVAGVIACDYYIVRRGYLDIYALFSGRRSSPYYFTYGFHWRAYAAYIAGILINIVGFVDAIGVGYDIPVAARYIYNFNFFAGFIVSAVVYYLLCQFAGPVPGMKNSGWWEAQQIDEDISFADDDHRGDVIGRERSGGDSDEEYKKGKSEV